MSTQVGRERLDTGGAGRRHCGGLFSWLVAFGFWGLITLPLAAEGPLTVGAAAYVDADGWFARYGLEAAEGGRPGSRNYTSAWTQIGLQRDSREMQFDGLRVFLGDAVQVRDGRFQLSEIDARALFAPLFRPQDFAATARPVHRIILDAGHGGQDSGTQNARLKLVEKELTLDVVRRLGGLLRTQGFDVRFTRETDAYVSLRDRAEFTRANDADLFVSIHFNATTAKEMVRGTETYVLTPQHQRSTSSETRDDGDAVEQEGNAADPWNAVLGFQMHRALHGQLQPFDRGLKRARFAVLRLIDCPGVLIESGYLSNDAEARRIATPEYRGKLAEAVAIGIAAYSSRVSGALLP